VFFEFHIVNKNQHEQGGERLQRHELETSQACYPCENDLCTGVLQAG